VGAYAGHSISPDGEVLDPAAWESRKGEWLPTPEDRARVAELMTPHYDEGDFAGWIARPPQGINNMPVEFDYVRFEEGLE
jgi:benzoyl-CoA 2,3-dioxygenase component B